MKNLIQVLQGCFGGAENPALGTAAARQPGPPPTTELIWEERPRDMLVLLFLLVLSAHIWVIVILSTQVPEQEPIKPAQLIETSLITLAAPKPAAPKIAAPAPPVAEKKPPLPKPEPKPKPVVKAVKLPKPTVADKIVDDNAVLPSAATQPQPVAANPAPTGSSTVAPATEPSPGGSSTVAPATDLPVTEAVFRGGYANKPKPDYPAIAQSRRWQGKVVLHVQVLTDGTAGEITVEKSSGHDMLDESALESMKTARFDPCKRGNKPFVCSMRVPFDFKLAE